MASGRIHAQDLRLGYNGELVLHLDEFTVEAGEFVSVLGPSGCGKSTLLAALAGFNEPMTGSIFIDDRDVTHVPPNKRDTGMVFQQYALFPHMTVGKNVEYGLTTRKVPRAERAERVREVLSLVGLSEFVDRYPKQLSGGQQQRVATARALVTRPKVLLLDEPLSNLDAKLRRQMRHEIRELQQQVGTTMVFVTHDQAEALATSDRVVLLAGGVLEQQGTPEELYRAPRTAFAADFIGAANLLSGTVDDAGRVAVLGRPTVLTADAAPGAAVTVALRPEAVTVHDPGADDPREALATVVSVGFSGERYDYRLRRNDDGMLSASPPAGAAPWSPGDRVAVRWADSAPILVGEK
ncbi:ABC transporter ATP-binding protein [Nakamurella flavida]|uniref:ABC-type quaternary amine transporter n=1 Tax=Nakamurella flavida TaxID=363630 RepID=A0A939C3X5_9ACTN|nr:ABC transporter ATP-binding protein [Nakamurella flavida]MBM9477496.1 ABC transporter ATP-binding protein [Nakamurella flavida]MDP9777429.1 putative spermidine/putrescine transport system ATP-binding protein [Nakamurella flavida]